MIRILFACAVSLVAAIGAAGANANADLDAAASRLWQAEWQWRLAQFPMLATQTGDHRFDDQLDDVSHQAQILRAKHWRDVLQQLDQIDTTKLSADTRTNVAIFRAQIEGLAENIELGGHLMPLNSDSSFYGGIAELARSHPFGTLHDYQNYLKRLRRIPKFFAQNIELLKLGLKKGMTVPRVTLQGRDQALVPYATLTDASKSPLYAPFLQMPNSINEADAEVLRVQAQQIILDALKPAYASLLAFMQDDYIPRARTTLGASKLPNGRTFYRRQILDFVTQDLSTDTIHEMGLEEVAQIRAEMQKILVELKFVGDYAAFLRFLRTDPQFYAQSEEQLLMHAAWIAKRIDGELPKFFNQLPRRPYGVQPVPTEIAPFYTSGRYIGAPFGSTDAGWYWMNTSKLDSRPLYTLPALTLHEAVPGHHLQIALASEQSAQPEFRRFSYISVYGEGWALYAESLGHAMGIYRTPYERFGQLTYAMWRANRLVVDTGIHAKGWSRQQAINYMMANTALSPHEVTTEVDRYISWPGQALSYMIGSIRIRELRSEAEKTLGAKFDLRAFHDALLSSGSVPLPVLSEQMRAWIRRQSLK